MYRVFVRTADGRERMLEWRQNGISIESDPVLRADLLAHAQALEGVRVGPFTGPYTDTAHLHSPLTTLVLIEDAFGPILRFEGELPQLAPGLEGAVL